MLMIYKHVMYLNFCIFYNTINNIYFKLSYLFSAQREMEHKNIINILSQSSKLI